jgi:hypothetical protein
MGNLMDVNYSSRYGKHDILDHAKDHVMIQDKVRVKRG